MNENQECNNNGNYMRNGKKRKNTLTLHYFFLS